MKILPYGPKVEILWSTPQPFNHVWLACNNTQKGVYAGTFNLPDEKRLRQNLIEYLVSAGHGNPLEHAVVSMRITQISRACADQLRTHRMTSPTMSSTHYQFHGEYNHRVHYKMVELGLTHGIAEATREYIRACEQIPVYEARQSLPLSVEVSYIMTLNVRSLLNFLKYRLCFRNTVETTMVAQHVANAVSIWFPELKKFLDFPCVYGECTEGKMACNKKAQATDFVMSLRKSHEDNKNAE